MKKIENYTKNQLIDEFAIHELLREKYQAALEAKFNIAFEACKKHLTKEQFNRVLKKMRPYC